MCLAQLGIALPADEPRVYLQHAVGDRLPEVGDDGPELWPNGVWPGSSWTVQNGRLRQRTSDPFDTAIATAR